MEGEVAARRPSDLLAFLDPDFLGFGLDFLVTMAERGTLTFFVRAILPCKLMMMRVENVYGQLIQMKIISVLY